MDYKKDISNTIGNLYLKHQLIYMPSEDMIKTYEDLESYTDFLYMAIELITKETAYFYLEDKLIEKILDVTNKFRFDYIKEPNINNLVNIIIVNANNIKYNMNNIEYIRPLIANYVTYQSDMRDIDFEDNTQLLKSLAKDYIIFYGLANKDDTIYQIDDFLISTNYFINYCEEIYEYPEVIDETERKLKEITEGKIKTNLIIKEYATSTQKVFQKIK